MTRRDPSRLEAHDPLDERQFLLAVRRLADSLGHGTDPSPFLGSGVDYVQSRPYQPGDPVKSIDWRVTARSGRVHVKEYQTPKRMPVWLLLDTSASMCVGSGRLTKYAWAVQVAGGLALAALARVSPVGLMGCGEREMDARPTLSRTRVLLWLHALRHFHGDEQTRLSRRVRELAGVAGNRSLVIVLSDLHDTGALPALKSLAQEHDVVVLQFWDPAEAGRTGGGIFRASEAETGKEFVGHGRSAWLEPGAFGEDLRRGAVDHLLLPVNEPFVGKLRGFLARRGLLGRGAR
ncbi:MAG: DUF58 domain-containing protein [Verrucomicrobiota bacterium]|jgi:uncharacterized protein (DUF58 family)